MDLGSLFSIHPLSGCERLLKSVEQVTVSTKAGEWTRKLLAWLESLPNPTSNPDHPSPDPPPGITRDRGLRGVRAGFRDEPCVIVLGHSQTVADRISRRDPSRDVPWQPQAIRLRGRV